MSDTSTATITVTKQPSLRVQQRVVVAVVGCRGMGYNCAATHPTDLHFAPSLQLVGAILWGYTMQPHYTPKAAAALLNISVSSLRNHCATFGKYLSADASPAPGIERRLSDHDIAVLQRIRELRATGLDTAGIVATLQTEDTTTLQPYIDAAIEPTKLQEAPQAITTALQPTDILQALQVVADVRYNDLQRQIDATNGAMADRLQWFVLGIGIGVLLTLYLQSLQICQNAE